MLRPPCGFMFAFMTAPFRFPETHKLTGLQCCQPWSYLRLVAYSFLGSCEGHRVGLETGCRSTPSSNFWLDTLPRPERLKKKRVATTKNDPKGWNGLSVRDAQAACGFSCSASK